MSSNLTSADHHKSSSDKKRRRRKTNSTSNELNQHFVNENMNPNLVVNGSAKPEEINGISVYEDDDQISPNSEGIVFQMNETLRQRETLIRQLSERLQLALQSRDHISQTAESMASQIDELKNQLKLVSNSLINRTIDGQPLCHDFECQTEWTEESSIEESRRMSESISRQSIASIALSGHTLVDQTLQYETFRDNSVHNGSDFIHNKCKQELEKLKNNLSLEFGERQRQIESKLSEQVYQLERQLKMEKECYLEERHKLGAEIERLKSNICDLESRNSHQSSENKEANHDVNPKVTISRSLSPLVPTSSPNGPDSHPVSRSPIFQTLQKYEIYS